MTEENEKKADLMEKEIESMKKATGEVTSTANDLSVKNAKEGDCLPSFFVQNDDRIRICIDIVFDKANGKIVGVSLADLGIDFSKFELLGHSQEWFEFTRPTYEKLTLYRQNCMVFVKEAGLRLVEQNRMRSFYLVYHLKDWSIKDKDGNKIGLKFDKDGSLNNESIAQIYNLYPTIVDAVLTGFEKEALLI